MANHNHDIAADTARLQHYAHAAPRCLHIKVNGTRCKSPAMNDNLYCYFHRALYNQPEFAPTDIGNLEDANSVQLAIQRVLSSAVRGLLDQKTARFLLSGLQIAARNLVRCKFEPELAEEIMLDDLGNTLEDVKCGDPKCCDGQPEKYPPLGKFVQCGTTDPVKIRHKRAARELLESCGVRS